MTISNEARRRAALVLRSKILAYILLPKHAAGLTSAAMAPHFRVSPDTITSHCHHLVDMNLVQRFVFPRTKNRLPQMWLAPGADTSHIIVPQKMASKKRVQPPQARAEIKQQRTDWPDQRHGTAKQLDVARDPLIAALFGKPAKAAP